MKLQVNRKRLFKQLNKKGKGNTIDMPYKDNTHERFENAGGKNAR